MSDQISRLALPVAIAAWCLASTSFGLKPDSGGLQTHPVMTAFGCALSGAQVDEPKLVLRDLTVIEFDSLAFDSDGVTGNKSLIGWDQIHSAELDDDQQAEFDRMLREFGLPLFRVRHRLANRDWSSLAEIVEPMYAAQSGKAVTDANRRSMYLVSLAAFRSRLASGKPAGALLPFIECCRMGGASSEGGPVQIPEIAAADLTPGELSSQFTIDLLPIWFDVEAAKRNFATLRVIVGDDLKPASDGALIYLASLSLAARETETATASLVELSRRSSALAAEWLPLLRVEAEIEAQIKGPATVTLRISGRNLDGPQRALANYLLAVQIEDHRDDFDVAMLDLLYIPAEYGSRQRELVAAALHRAALIASQAGRMDEADILKSELLNHYQNTYHGGLQIAR